jgi:hypothetical protein
MCFRVLVPALCAMSLGCTKVPDAEAESPELAPGPADAQGPRGPLGSGPVPGALRDPGGSAPTLRASGPVVCADPTQVDLLGPYFRVEVPIPEPAFVHLEGGNATIADLDGDGALDIVVVGDREVFAWRRVEDLGVSPPRVLLTTPAPPERSGLFGATAADVDDDGDLDLVVTGRNVADHLLINDGTGAFADLTDVYGLGGYTDHHSTGASLADFDRDGDLDLVIGGHGLIDETRELVTEFGPGDPTRLYLRTPQGYLDVSERIPGTAHDGYTFMVGWLDADDDSDEDMLLINDFGNVLTPCQLLLNDGSAFVHDAGALGLDLAIPGMGLGIGDLDGDGREDLAIPAWRRNALMFRRGDLWFDESQVWNYVVRGNQTVGWGSEIYDLDHSGTMDISTVFGYVDTRFGERNELEQSDALHMQNRPGWLVDQAWAGAVDDTASHRSRVIADLDDNGWLDHVRVGLDGVLRVDLARCDTDAWLKVHLRQAAPNTHAIGARVEVDAGGVTRTQRLRAGGTGFGPGGPPELMFGLGQVDHVEALRVVWPDGRVDQWTDLQPRQELWIHR